MKELFNQHESEAWDVLMKQWAKITKLRNDAAHESAVGSKETVEEIREALACLQAAGVFRSLYNLKRELRDADADVAAGIARLAGLEFTAPVVVRYDDTAVKRKAIDVLDRAHLLSPSDRRALDLPNRGDAPDFPADSAIIDILGEYAPDRGEIVIYEKMCRMAATTLDVDVEALKRVVLTHEIAHAVTHLGVDSRGHSWRYFDLALVADKEMFAQIYSLRYFKDKSKALHETIFRKLAEHQDGQYNTWREYEFQPLDTINGHFHKTRLEMPSFEIRIDMKDAPESLRSLTISRGIYHIDRIDEIAINEAGGVLMSWPGSSWSSGDALDSLDEIDALLRDVEESLRGSWPDSSWSSGNALDSLTLDETAALLRFVVSNNMMSQASDADRFPQLSVRVGCETRIWTVARDQAFVQKRGRSNDRKLQESCMELIDLVRSTVERAIERQVVEIPDRELRKAVSKELSVPGGTPVTKRQMESISDLQVGDVEGLMGLEWATNLKSLSLWFRSRHVDLSLLGLLPKLKRVRLSCHWSDDDMADLPLTFGLCESLETLELKIEFGSDSLDLAPLTRLPQLKNLELNFRRHVGWPAHEVAATLSTLGPCESLENLLISFGRDPVKGGAVLDLLSRFQRLKSLGLYMCGWPADEVSATLASLGPCAYLEQLVVLLRTGSVDLAPLALSPRLKTIKLEFDGFKSKRDCPAHEVAATLLTLEPHRSLEKLMITSWRNSWSVDHTDISTAIKSLERKGIEVDVWVFR